MEHHPIVTIFSYNRSGIKYLNSNRNITTDCYRWEVINLTKILLFVQFLLFPITARTDWPNKLHPIFDLIKLWR